MTDLGLTKIATNMKKYILFFHSIVLCVCSFYLDRYSIRESHQWVPCFKFCQLRDTDKSLDVVARSFEQCCIVRYGVIGSVWCWDSGDD